ncbi:unnamed protein product [Polarella glacialis]|uniref:Uncharacterized protein n=1 Tax=Polarella glacialis TaxID=89957 RepID=A0A813M393_POLGL|nr:unnamed protein product [Polarella glacialis]
MMTDHWCGAKGRRSLEISGTAGHTPGSEAERAGRNRRLALRTTEGTAAKSGHDNENLQHVAVAAPPTPNATVVGRLGGHRDRHHLWRPVTVTVNSNFMASAKGYQQTTIAKQTVHC